MEIGIFILSFLVVCGFALTFYYLRKQKTSSEILEWLKMTNSRLDRQNSDISSRLDNTSKYLGLVQKSIGELSEIGRGMKDLSEFLNSPKIRGNIGEQVLKDMLLQVLPHQSFRLQYKFRSGSVVDAAVFTANGIIPVDSKFPMENIRKLLSANAGSDKKVLKADYNRDFRKHIDDVSKKYILAAEGTTGYALLYIPSESVYYETVNDPDLYDYAASKKVFPVSPMTFYAFLQAILMSFEGQKIEKRSREILDLLSAIRKDYEKTEENMSVLIRHVTNAYNQLSEISRSFGNLGQKLTLSSILDGNKIPKETESGKDKKAV